MKRGFIIFVFISYFGTFQAQCNINFASNFATGCTPLEVVFNVPAVNSSPPHFVWDFGVSTQTGITVSHIFQYPGAYIVTLTVIGVTCTPNQFTTSVNVVTGAANGCTNTIVVGLEEVTKTVFKLSPNPSNGNFLIETQGYSGKSEIIIYSLTGQKILQQEINGNKKEIDCSVLSKGIYLVGWYDAQQTIRFTKLLIE